MAERSDIEFKDEIGFFRNVFPKDFCKHIIAEFERLESENGSIFRDRRLDDGELEHRKNDKSLFMNFLGQDIKEFRYFDNDGNFIGSEVSYIFFKGIQACMEEYVGKYSILNMNKLRGTSMKVQRTLPGGGYHIWHCERSGTQETSGRELVYMLYLNSIPLGGETEFLYKKLRVPPEENMVLIWPAGFTHAHRGNMVLGDDTKYIITGWILAD